MIDGVYTKGPDSEPRLVHAFLEGDYGLADIGENFRLGRFAGQTDERFGPTLALTRKELRDLKNFADAYSFDYDPGFIEMCVDIHRAASELPGEEVAFFEPR